MTENFDEEISVIAAETLFGTRTENRAAEVPTSAVEMTIRSEIARHAELIGAADRDIAE